MIRSGRITLEAQPAAAIGGARRRLDAV